MRHTALLLALFSTALYAENSLTLINKTQHKMHFSLYEKTAEVFPEVPPSFELENNGTFRINRFNFSLYDSGYIHGEIDEHKQVFFALDQDFVIHGYIGSGIAYSWTYNPSPTIVFCKPSHYQKYDTCLNAL